MWIQTSVFTGDLGALSPDRSVAEREPIKTHAESTTGCERGRRGSVYMLHAAPTSLSHREHGYVISTHCPVVDVRTVGACRGWLL